MKTAVTKLMNTYRECVRHLWNTYFLDLLSIVENQWDVSDEFDEICTTLFSSLVLNPIGCTSHKKSQRYEGFPTPLSCLHVVPSAKDGVPIQIAREIQSFTYWDYPIDVIKPLEVDLRFIDFFDFDVLGYKEFEYYRVRIVDSSEYPDIIGRDALLKTRYATVFFVDESEES